MGIRRGIVLAMTAVGVSAAGVAAAIVPGFKLLVLHNQIVKWQAAPTQTGAQTQTITYGFVREAMAFPRAYNCKRLLPVAGLATASRLAEAAVEAEIVEGLKQWEAVTPLRFKPAADWRHAQILIGAREKAAGSAFADVFPQPNYGPIAPIEKSLICFNPEHKWKIGFDGDLRSYDIQYVAAHEAGHAIGLDHPSKTGQLMSYRYQETFRTLQAGDVHGAKQLYDGRHGLHVARRP